MFYPSYNGILDLNQNSMADSLDVFHTKCSSIITRMIDAVPAGVKLTELITPTLVKPDDIKLIRNSDNSLSLFGRVRVRFLTRWFAECVVLTMTP
jgi:hypothetical protein